MTDAVTTTTNPPTVTTVTVKPAWKTTEAWLSLAAMVLTAAFAVGLIGPTGTVSQVAGLIGMVLTAMGHAVTRSYVKVNS